jgi:hypothetical protein
MTVEGGARIPVGTLVLGLVALAAGTAAAAARFGTECAEQYQNGWQNTLPYSWARCSGFNDELDDTDTKVFYWDLNGAKYYWETNGDQYEPDFVHLFYANTHGGGWWDKSVWAMWNQGSLADSQNMRLGDESFGTHIFATYACETMRYNDGRFWVRMGPIFRGGVKYAMGSHDKVWMGWTTDEVGEDFADNLQKGEYLWSAWANGNSDWYFDQDITAMATGANSGDCNNRLYYMKWQNFGSYGRLRDGQIGWWCGYAWDNL